MENLPQDVLWDILSRLSVKHLCQLKCVSKQWFNLISDSHFKKLYNNRSIKYPRLLLVKESTVGHPALFGMPLSRTLYISTVDVCTGRVEKLFTRDIVGKRYNFIFGHNLVCYEKFMAIAVCNPTTSEIVHLPLPSQLSISYNLGYLRAKNEYKIVHLFKLSELCGGSKTVGFEIITLQDGGPVPGSWRSLANHSLNWDTRDNLIASASVNRAIYWLIYKKMVEGRRSFNERRIISFELENEEFESINAPNEDYSSDVASESEQLFELKGFLCLAKYSKKSSSMTMFTLKDQQNQTWIKEYVIDLCNLGHRFRVAGYVSINDDDDDNGEIIILRTRGRPLVYNTKKMSFRKVGQPDIWKGCYQNIYFDRFFSLETR
ncbi:F-box/LRR-repeat protein [Abeliophyllum distichum]|uniref:F-box/LRR-repeat protein n=1 Tax=Abeliophyllum distichum TaxID=126358 RepID=A0ABD1R1G7_9LAMI